MTRRVAQGKARNLLTRLRCGIGRASLMSRRQWPVALFHPAVLTGLILGLRSGLSETTSTGFRLRVLPLQRSGCSPMWLG